MGTLLKRFFIFPPLSTVLAKSQIISWLVKAVFCPSWQTSSKSNPTTRPPRRLHPAPSLKIEFEIPPSLLHSPVNTLPTAANFYWNFGLVYLIHEICSTLLATTRAKIRFFFFLQYSFLKCGFTILLFLCLH